LEANIHSAGQEILCIYGTWSLLLRPQEPALSPCPEPYEFNSQLPMLFLYNILKY